VALPDRRESRTADNYPNRKTWPPHGRATMLPWGNHLSNARYVPSATRPGTGTYVTARPAANQPNARRLPRRLAAMSLTPKQPPESVHCTSSIPSRIVPLCRQRTPRERVGGAVLYRARDRNPERSGRRDVQFFLPSRPRGRSLGWSVGIDQRKVRNGKCDGHHTGVAKRPWYNRDGTLAHCLPVSGHRATRLRTQRAGTMGRRSSPTGR
jgi:hypothetical protein